MAALASFVADRQHDGGQNMLVPSTSRPRRNRRPHIVDDDKVSAERAASHFRGQAWRQKGETVFLGRGLHVDWGGVVLKKRPLPTRSCRTSDCRAWTAGSSFAS